MSRPLLVLGLLACGLLAAQALPLHDQRLFVLQASVSGGGAGARGTLEWEPQVSPLMIRAPWAPQESPRESFDWWKSALNKAYATVEVGAAQGSVGRGCPLLLAPPDTPPSLLPPGV